LNNIAKAFHFGGLFLYTRSMNLILFDGKNRGNLLPFTFTRPVAEIRIGILTITEKWAKYSGVNPSFCTQDYLSIKYPAVLAETNLMVNGSVCPNRLLWSEIIQLKTGEALYLRDTLVACMVSAADVLGFTETGFEPQTKVQSSQQDTLVVNHTYDIFSKNGKAIEDDFDLITHGRTSAPISSTNQTVNAERIFIEPGAQVEFSILNASGGAIYIGADAEVMEGCKVRGPFALCEHGGLKMDAKIYGPTTVGPHCKVGGEVNNVVFFAYSNKGHDGFMGNAVVGEWVNIGADTNNSNLKNTYDEVKLWNYTTERFEKTGLTFCGVMLADHAKCGINTMFNTGTVVGVGANIFGAGFPRNFIPSFAWGGAQGFDTFVLNKFYKTAEAMCARRNISFTDDDKAIMKHVFEQTAKFRFWEKGSE
jgi:UDP-N-acetylglucosamine diphosphorylase/glucosamine-1-phosphate N-acetyltransferase